MDIEYKAISFVGVAFSDKVIYNLVEHDPELINTGLSIIQHLKNDKNKFISKIIESQSYNNIKYIFDDEVIFNDFYDWNNENRESFYDIQVLIEDDNAYEYFYIYDLDSDTLLIKTPELNYLTSINYQDSKEVRDIINNTKG